MALPRTITIPPQNEMGSNDFPATASVGSSSDHASAEWASAYLSRWLEECDAASGPGGRQQRRRPSPRPRADSPVPVGRPRSHHGHDSLGGLMSTLDLLSSLRTLDDCPEPRGSRDGACGSGSRSADSLSSGFVNTSDRSYSKAQHRPSRTCSVDPTDSGQEARKVHFATRSSDNGNGTANHQDSGRAERVAVPLNIPPKQAENPPEMSGPSTRILNLPWTDHQGFPAYYSGGINMLKQPHGYGTLVYKDGRSVRSMWNNGTSLQDDWHRRWKKKRSASCTYAKSRPSTRSRPGARAPPAAEAHPIDPKPFESSFEAGRGIDRGPPRSPSCIVRELPDFPAPPFSPPRYDVGDAGDPDDMIAPRDPVAAHRLVASLEVHDFAWVLRSNGDWTYAIVSDFPGRGGAGGQRASVRFVVDDEGSTKTVEARDWARFVRRVNWKRADDKENDANDAFPSY